MRVIIYFRMHDCHLLIRAGNVSLLHLDKSGRIDPENKNTLKNADQVAKFR